MLINNSTLLYVEWLRWGIHCATHQSVFCTSLFVDHVAPKLSQSLHAMRLRYSISNVQLYNAGHIIFEYYSYRLHGNDLWLKPIIL